MWFFVHKRFSNTNIKLISYLVDGMQLMISRELEIVGLEECPTYKKKKAIIRTQQYQILESKIALQHKKTSNKLLSIDSVQSNSRLNLEYVDSWLGL